MEAIPPDGPNENWSARRRHRLSRFMARQDFIAHRDELIAEGFSPSQIKNWVRSGRLVTIIRSVFAYGRDIETRSALWRAALLAAGPGSALTGRSACEALGLVRTWPGMPAVVEVASPAGQARRFRGMSPNLRNTTVSVVRRNFEPGDVLTLEGISTVKPALALIDFAGDASRRAVWFAFLEACRLFHFGPEDARFLSARMSNRAGAGKMRPLVDRLERSTSDSSREPG